jgi:hypothetical protein
MFLGCGVLLVCGLQDPPPAKVETAPPPAAVPAPAEPGLEGVYELRRRIANGTEVAAKSTGYVAITKRHLFLCLVAEGPTPELALLRSGVRTWQAGAGQRCRTECKLGYFTDAEGNIHVEAPGAVEQKRIEWDAERRVLRIWQDERSHLEFERVE